jgi:hypothetical protein
VEFVPKSQKNCKKRTKIVARTHVNSSQKRQIVKNGVDQVDLGGVGTSGNEEEK